MAALVLVIEDRRGEPTWRKLVEVIASCRCSQPVRVEVRSLGGPLEGQRLCKALRALRLRYPGAGLAAAPDADRYGGPGAAVERLRGELRRHCRGMESVVEVVPVVDKLEDWVYALLAGRPCRCCGVEGLSRLLGEKYEKYMAATRLPRLLEEGEKRVCERLSEGTLAASTGLDRLAALLCSAAGRRWG